MRLDRELRLYLIALHAALFVAVLTLLRDQAGLMIAAEAALATTLGVGLWLARRTLEPLDYTRQFRELLGEGEYASRLRPAASGEVNELVSMFNRLLATLYQERLAAGEQRGLLQQLLDATPAAVLVFDFDRRLSLANPSAHALLGLAGMEGRPLAAGLPAPAAATSEQRAQAALLLQLDALPVGPGHLLNDGYGRRFRCQRGQFFDRGFAREFIMLEELTAELEQSEKEVHERLIRILAHEVNNTVGATGSVLDSLLFYRDQLRPEDADDYTTAISATRQRNARLGEFIARFTQVVRMPQPELQPCSFDELLRPLVDLYRERCRNANIAVHLRLAPGQQREIQADPQLMEQALMNILKNAIEAVEQGGVGGAIDIDVQRDGDAWRLQIIDTAGLLRDLPPGQLFSPFFSTKRGGQGLGLLFVREVLQRHGLRHRLEAFDGGRTCFSIWFDQPPAGMSGVHLHAPRMP